MAKLLNGVKVVELSGLAPVPHCGLVLADFGAQVTVVEKKEFQTIEQRLNRGKDLVLLDLKDPTDLKKVQDMCKVSDVLLDPYRPGILEKIGLDPLKLLQQNERLIICRITGYGQTGRMRSEAGHDINYVSLSGMLPIFSGAESSRPWPPVNMLADFAGGGLTAAFGIVSALHARSQNGGKGCVIDCSMTEGISYLGAFVQHYYDQSHMFTDKYGIFTGECPLYRTYKTKDDKFIAVGALEPKFHQNMFRVLGFDGSDIFDDPEKLVRQMEQIFLTRTRDEWWQIFEGKDCCVTPVLNMDEVGEFGLHKDRRSFQKSEVYGGTWIAKPAPRILTIDDLRSKSSKL
ncbi:unnamed protein product [Caenorhabditis bovis]|uniref:Uncharacterized protein n=1 Tax=Caenorhabditis bovis TaxID=2654633 RepID=A0A8S1EJY6_9PELO|nr:unnamed protein product [Caenorhabditis bovis]